MPPRNLSLRWFPFGDAMQIRLNGRWVEMYKKAKPELLDLAQPWIVTLTQEQAGITHKAIDRVHTVPLSAATKALIATIQKDKVVTLPNGSIYAAESDMSADELADEDTADEASEATEEDAEEE